MRYYSAMNWKQLIADIRSRGATLAEIAKTCGFASPGHVHDVANGRQPGVMWEVGDALIKLHKRVMRRKA